MKAPKSEKGQKLFFTLYSGRRCGKNVEKRIQSERVDKKADKKVGKKADKIYRSLQKIKNE